MGRKARSLRQPLPGKGGRAAKTTLGLLAVLGPRRATGGTHGVFEPEVSLTPGRLVVSCNKDRIFRPQGSGSRFSPLIKLAKKEALWIGLKLLRVRDRTNCTFRITQHLVPSPPRLGSQQSVPVSAVYMFQLGSGPRNSPRTIRRSRVAQPVLSSLAVCSLQGSSSNPRKLSVHDSGCRVQSVGF